MVSGCLGLCCDGGILALAMMVGTSSVIFSVLSMGPATLAVIVLSFHFKLFIF